MKIGKRKFIIKIPFVWHLHIQLGVVLPGCLILGRRKRTEKSIEQLINYTTGSVKQRKKKLFHKYMCSFSFYFRIKRNIKGALSQKYTRDCIQIDCALIMCSCQDTLIVLKRAHLYVHVDIQINVIWIQNNLKIFTSNPVL